MNKRKQPLEALHPMIICDFDGVLHWDRLNVVGDAHGFDIPVPGACEWVLGAVAQGYDVVIWSCSCNTPKGEEDVRAWLKRNGFPDLRILHEHKPYACMFLDDHAMRFAGEFPVPGTLHDIRSWNRPNQEATHGKG
jgi:hypothetical protein